MRNITKSWNIRLAGLILLFWITTNMMSAQAMPLSDAIDDVWAQQTQTKGNFMAGIDIAQVSTQGSTIIIECKGVITSSLTSMEVSRNYFILFSDDGDPTNWEAAMMLSFRSSNDHEACWVVANQMTDPVEFWEIGPDWVGWWGHCNAWSMGFEETHYVINENQITFYFLEFAGIFGAEILCVTMAVAGTEVYYDWAPNFYEFKRRFKVSTSKLTEVVTTTPFPPLPITTGPITEMSTSTTPVSSETTIPLPTVSTSTSEEPITALTETEPEASTEQKTTPSEGTIPTEIPGFEALPILAALPILIWLRKRAR